MPNWVSTRLCVEGPAEQIAAFKQRAASVVPQEGEKARVLSFDAFIPMPPELNVTAGSDGDLGYAAFHTTEVRTILGYPYIQQAGILDREGLQLYLDLTRPEARVQGDAYASNMAKYGHKNWYDWSIANWGTKWDASEPELVDEDETRLEYRFNTAWSPVEPVIAAMSEQFPELTFTGEFDEESHAFYYQATWQEGVKGEETELEREPDGFDDYDGDDEEQDENADGSGSATEGEPDEA